MRRVLLSAGLALLLPRLALANPLDDQQRGQAELACIVAAAQTYALPDRIFLIILDVEGGQLGRASPNSNGTVDIGPMQINTAWLPRMARHWKTSVAEAYRALRDNFCANIEAGGWILRRAIDEAQGDFWEGVGFYHSHDGSEKSAYLRHVLTDALRLSTHAPRAVGQGGP